MIIELSIQKLVIQSDDPRGKCGYPASQDKVA